MYVHAISIRSISCEAKIKLLMGLKQLLGFEPHCF